MANFKTKNEVFNELTSKLSVTRMYSVIITILFIISTSAFLITFNSKYFESQSIHSEYQKTISEKDKNTKNLLTQIDSMQKLIDELYSISAVLDEQNKSLVQSNEEYYTELVEFREREELYDKYHYALINISNKRTDITYDQLRTLESLLADAKVNDPDLILAWIMTESGGDETAKSNVSSAKGYGQFLDSTAQYVYTKLLGEDNWSPELSLDGTVNIIMMSAYIEWLYKYNDYDLYTVIQRYRGKEDISGYIGRMNQHLARSGTGKTVQSIIQEIDSRYN